MCGPKCRGRERDSMSSLYEDCRTGSNIVSEYASTMCRQHRGLFCSKPRKDTLGYILHKVVQMLECRPIREPWAINASRCRHGPCESRHSQGEHMSGTSYSENARDVDGASPLMQQVMSQCKSLCRAKGFACACICLPGSKAPKRQAVYF